MIEWSQKNKKELTFESNEAQDENAGRTGFESMLIMENTVIGIGAGNSKKEAEQKAAKLAYQYLERL
ncbi:MAG: hypothetical protein HC896_01880 [Bacteroidales bacterium]|nr:hypothetical protein [Bacteroidales bacterium]